MKKELEKVEAGMTNLKENELESFFKEKLLPLVKNYGFNFSYDDLREYKNSLLPQSGEELDDDFLDQVAGGLASCTKMGWGLGETMGRRGDGYGMCLIVGVNFGG